MTEYRETLRLNNLDFNKRKIVAGADVSRNTIHRVIEKAKDLNISDSQLWHYGQCPRRNIIFRRKTNTKEEASAKLRLYP